MILGINNLFQANNVQNQHKNVALNHKATPIGLQSDTVSFGKKVPTPNAKMRNFAQMYLKEIGLKKGQPLHITAEARYVPFMRVLEEEAYKKGARRITRKTIEPEFEALKKKHGITEDFDFESLAKKELEDNGTLFVAFDEKNCPYRKSGLTKSETRKLTASITDKYPKEVEDEYRLDPKEILKDALDMHPGEPLTITAEREHLPRALALADWAYGQNRTRLISLNINEKSEFHPDFPKFEYGPESIIGDIPASNLAKLDEFVDKDIARLFLRGDDPNRSAALSPQAKKRRTLHDSKYSEVTEVQQEELLNNHPWYSIWVPSTRAIQETYAEHADKNTRMTHGLRDAKLINRSGQLAQHIERLEYMAKKMNELLKKGFRSLQLTSLDPQTWKPDGKTDLRVGLCDLSIFKSARMDMKRSGHKVLVNSPTEEIFTAPKAFPTEEELQTGKILNMTNGHVTVTRPIVIKGVVIDEVHFVFKDGRIVEIKAKTNEEYLRDHIQANENADRPGEIALVEDSYLAKLNKVHKNILLDENTTCHIAFGDCYTESIEGAEDVLDFEERTKYLRKHGANRSRTHVDFMVGGPNVSVTSINEITGEQILVLEKNKFQL